MATLSNNWITERVIDFEYKQYILLAYLKEVSENFDENKLYPYMAELFEHYKNTLLIKENRQHLLNAFPKKLTSLDTQQVKIEYEKLIHDDSLMREIESIINFSIPKFEHYLNEGKKIYEFIEQHINIHPVGVMPLNLNEGYLFIRNGNKPTDVYEYQITLFEKAEEKFRAIHTSFLLSYPKSINTTYESIKSDLIRTIKKLPNPATYALETDMVFPLTESLLPIAKRALVRYVSMRA